MEQQTIAIGCDHAGYDYKEAIAAHLSEAGYLVLDMGTHSSESVDYPDFVHPVAEAIEQGKANLGVLICGSANGVAITANKHQQIRAAIAWEEELASLARQHNNANVICLPARFISQDLAVACVDTFLQSEFEGGRHQRRVDKMTSFC
ncbi:MAG: ribose 5-phosphate isomerase B [Chitinophagales bacterium]|nr:ribose 5-phosphate isomerase B [Chitinophagales bacterium]HAE13558.1 ribose 5-phosphate isomerase B [Bacteroidota bacterium]MCB9018759.1 ribose 5-phosphate isomerase B [Chitinophagales bacterium]MCB9020949.1 ribose 5-phosphate isomerase B [Chitinophagales bacterium]MCB9031844.1 ribose 5-phosphate isomerase B [Chitinophagales bacterium]